MATGAQGYAATHAAKTTLRARRLNSPEEQRGHRTPSGDHRDNSRPARTRPPAWLEIEGRSATRGLDSRRVATTDDPRSYGMIAGTWRLGRGATQRPEPAPAGSPHPRMSLWRYSVAADSHARGRCVASESQIFLRLRAQEVAPLLPERGGGCQCGRGELVLHQRRPDRIAVGDLIGLTILARSRAERPLRLGNATSQARVRFPRLAVLGMDEATLAEQRHQRRGPRYTRLACRRWHYRACGGSDYGLVDKGSHCGIQRLPST